MVHRSSGLMHISLLFLNNIWPPGNLIISMAAIMSNMFTAVRNEKGKRQLNKTSKTVSYKWEIFLIPEIQARVARGTVSVNQR